MKEPIVSGATALVVAALATAAWFLAPRLQSADRIVNLRAEEHTERARRMLERYDPGIEPIADLVARSGAIADLGADDIDKLVDDDPVRTRDLLDGEATRLNDLLLRYSTDSRELTQRLQALDPGATRPSPGRIQFGQNAESMVRDMSDGIQYSAAEAITNSKSLEQAISAAGRGLGEAMGEALGSGNLHANRMNGVALYHRGLSERRSAALRRMEAEAALSDMTDAFLGLSPATARTRRIESSGIRDAIQAQVEATGAQGEQLEALNENVVLLDGKIREMQEELARQTAAAEEARALMEALEARGLQYEQGDPVGEFRKQYEQFARNYRDAVRKAHILRHGTLANARIDASGDYIEGEYVSDSPSEPIQFQRGLDEFETQLASAKATRDGAQEALADAEATLAALRQLEAEYSAQAAAASETAVALGNEVQEHFARYRKTLDQVTAHEDEAVKLFVGAAKAFDAAKQIGSRRTTDTPTVSPRIEETSPIKLIREDRWLPAHAQCQAADARVAAALVLYDRFAHLRRALSTLDATEGQVSLEGFDRQAFEGAIQSARGQAEELLDLAITALESASGSLRQHWTVAASAAAADYALALFDHPELIGVAIANYENVVADRRDNPYVRPFLKRLEQLRNRPQ